MSDHRIPLPQEDCPNHPGSPMSGIGWLSTCGLGPKCKDASHWIGPAPFCQKCLIEEDGVGDTPA